MSDKGYALKSKLEEHSELDYSKSNPKNTTKQVAGFNNFGFLRFSFFLYYIINFASL